jgi:predicted transposase/invertase (TIGR01784 family)
MRYDNPIKLIAEAYPNDIASWVAGFPLKGQTLEATELPSAPIRADFLFRDETNRKVVHVEFQTAPDRDMALRMLEYWVRLQRRYPDYEPLQYVVYLRPTGSKYVEQSGLSYSNLTYTFNTIRLWEVPSEKLMSNKIGLLPFAVLGKCPDKEEMVKQVLNKLELLPDSEKKDILVFATTLFSELVLKDRTVNFEELRVNRFYQKIFQEAIAKARTESLEEGIQIGRGEGIEMGREKTLKEVTQRLLKSGLTRQQISEYLGLTPKQIQELQPTNIQPKLERKNIHRTRTRETELD